MKPSLFEDRALSPSGSMTSSASSFRAVLGSVKGAAIGTRLLTAGGGRGAFCLGVSRQASMPMWAAVILPGQTQPTLLLKMSPLR